MRIFNRNILSILCFGLISVYSVGGMAQCNTLNTTFKCGEVVNYDIFYNWHFIWLSAGKVYFRVDSAQKGEKKLYHFNSYGETFKEYDWFYKVRDNFEVFVDSTEFKPLRFIRNTYEGGYKVDNRYFFDYDNKRILTVTENSKKPQLYDTLKLPECTYDVLSTIYYARNIDYNRYHPGDKIPLSVIVDNELFNLYIKYLGKTEIELHGGRKFRCIIFKPLLVEGTIFSGGEDMTVWVTDDENKIPVQVEAKILVGSIKAIVKDTEGLRHDSDAELFE